MSLTAAMSATQLLRRVRRLEGHVHRMRDERTVFVITRNPDLAEWLLELGATCYSNPSAVMPSPEPPLGGYIADRVTGATEWDILIHNIPVLGSETLWQAAKEDATVDYA